MTQETKSQKNQKMSFALKGMSCTSCAANIEKKLNSTEGIINANINFATEKGQVKFKQEVQSPEKIISIIKDLGYEAAPEVDDKLEKITVKLKGMTCTSCAGNIEKKLNDMEGIKSANVNFAVEKVTIEYDTKKVRLIDMKKKVDGLGYELVLEENKIDNVDEDEIKIKKAAKKMKISIALSSIIMGLMIVHMFVRAIPGYLPIVALLGFPIVFGTGLHVHVGSFKALKNKSPNMDVLVTLGALPTYII
jgi:Cu+-exporting ATPase